MGRPLKSAGAIKGVAYLHKICIVHRDIKPENLVVDRDFCLKIIDFDVAMRVKGEDEVVDGQCGREGGLDGTRDGGEVDVQLDQGGMMDNRASCPLSSEQVQDEDRVLRPTATKLTTRNPERRLSLLQVAASLSDVVSVAVERKATRSRRTQWNWTEKRRVPEGEESETFTFSARQGGVGRSAVTTSGSAWLAYGLPEVNVDLIGLWSCGLMLRYLASKGRR